MISAPSLAGYFGELSGTSAALRLAAGTMLVQPIGSVEHHGAHLPLFTDAFIAGEVAREVVRRHPELDIAVMPTLSYGLSSEHLWAPGTVTLSPSTVLAVIDEVGASAARAGATRFVLLNAHGGNTHLLRVAARELRVRHGLTAFIAHCDLPADNGGPAGDPREEGLGIHGGINETSVMLHLRPELVDMSAAVRSVPSWIREYATVGFEQGNEFAWASNDLSDDGVCGDPTLASADIGAERFDHSVETVAASLAEMLAFGYRRGPAAAG